MKPSTPLRGTIHGKTIQLDQEPGLPEGQVVSVTVRAEAGEAGGLRRAFGAWADDGAELDAFVERVQQDRSRGRAEPTG